jgi:outer membrane immunogenic protein
MTMQIKVPVTAIILALTAPIANAGGIGEPAVAPVNIAPASAVRDWSGFYAGVQLTYLEPIGSSDFAFYEDDPWDETRSAGGFAGYNFQSGSFVYGAEALVTFYDGENVTFPGEFLEHFVEVRGRAGYAFNDVLLYGALGLTTQTWSDATADVTLNGYTAALGVDYAINDAWFIGAEVAYRDLSNDEGVGFLSNEIIVNEESFRLRLGYRF